METGRRAEYAQPVRGDAAESRDVTKRVSAEMTDAVLAEGHAGPLCSPADLSTVLAAQLLLLCAVSILRLIKAIQ